MKKTTRKGQQPSPPPSPSPEEEEEAEKGIIITSPSLPNELILHILSMLPTESILRFRCVSKHWCNKLIKDPNLVKAHLNRSIENHNSTLLIYYKPLKKPKKPKESGSGSGSGSTLFTINLAGSSSPLSPRKEGDVLMMKDPFNSKKDVSFYCSCNGLVLMNNPWQEDEEVNDNIMLWNPSTAEIKLIPKPVDDDDGIATSSGIGGKKKKGSCSHSYIYGLEYCRIMDDYKIVRIKILFNWRDEVCNGCEIKVYTLGTNSWKTIPYEFSYDLYLSMVNQKLMPANGALHLIRAPCDSVKKGLQSAVSRVIVAFDVEHDVIEEVPLTSGLQESLVYGGRNSLASKLGSFDGCLSVILGDFFSILKADEISIWVMKEYGDRESWTKMYSITNRSMMRSIRYLKMVVWDFIHGMLLFLKDDSSLVLFDPKHEIATDVDLGGFSPGDYYPGCMQTYLVSLVSLNSGTYLGQKNLKG